MQLGSIFVKASQAAGFLFFVIAMTDARAELDSATLQKLESLSESKVITVSKVPNLASRSDKADAVDMHPSPSAYNYELELLENGEPKRYKTSFANVLETKRIGNYQWSDFHPAVEFVIKSFTGRRDTWPESKNNCVVFFGQRQWKRDPQSRVVKYFVLFNNINWKTLKLTKNSPSTWQITAAFVKPGFAYIDAGPNAYKGGQLEYTWQDFGGNVFWLNFTDKSEAERRMKALRDIARLCPKSTSSY